MRCVKPARPERLIGIEAVEALIGLDLGDNATAWEQVASRHAGTNKPAGGE